MNNHVGSGLMRPEVRPCLDAVLATKHAAPACTFITGLTTSCSM